MDGHKAQIPTWKQLINHPLLTEEEKCTLIMAIFSNRDEVGEVNHLCGDDAQSFVDAIDKVGAFYLRGIGLVT
jgi:hypothetical protein